MAKFTHGVGIVYSVGVDGCFNCHNTLQKFFNGGIVMENNNNLFYTVSEFAEILSLSSSTVARGVRNSIYPFNRSLKIGRRRLFPASLIAELENLAYNEKPNTGVIK